jgi:hypothetical protein
VCTPEQGLAHHWRYETYGEGGIVAGACLHCGSTRSGDNVFIGDRDPVAMRKAPRVYAANKDPERKAQEKRERIVRL